MIEIIPAIMPDSPEDLKRKHSRVKDFVSTVQIDVMDGQFVPSKSWPYIDTQISADYNSSQSSESQISADRYNLPKIDFDFEVDLMVENPEKIVEEWISAGAKRIIVHIESVKNFGEIFDAVSGKAELGIALNTTTSNDTIEPFIERADSVQFMGIEKIGYQGQKFDNRVIQKITDLRKRYPEIIISVDGGVSLETAPSLVKAGANRLVSGSAIFESNNIEETIKQFRHNNF